MSTPSSEHVDRLWQALPPQARLVLQTMAQMQNRPVEDVLRDEIEHYIAGKVPAVDIDSAMRSIQQTAYGAGYWLGRLRGFARRMGQSD